MAVMRMGLAASRHANREVWNKALLSGRYGGSQDWCFNRSIWAWQHHEVLVSMDERHLPVVRQKFSTIAPFLRLS